jgi:hypothetical protein
MRPKLLLAWLVALVTSVAGDASFAATKKTMVVTILGCGATCAGFKDGIAKCRAARGLIRWSQEDLASSPEVGIVGPNSRTRISSRGGLLSPPFSAP